MTSLLFLYYSLSLLSLVNFILNSDDVTWVSPNSQMYNGSVRNSELDEIIVTCKSTLGNGDLGLRSSVENIDQYFRAGLFNDSFELPDAESSLTVSVLSDYDIVLSLIGSFDSSLNGEYTCFSRESGKETTIVLTTGKC